VNLYKKMNINKFVQNKWSVQQVMKDAERMSCRKWRV